MGWRAYLFLSIALFPASVAAAETLVLTVEVGPGQPLTPDEIRAAVALEVGGKVLRAAAQESGARSDILIIDVDQGQAGMVFRSPGGDTRRRSVVLPPTREEGLRLISWTALNLIRDQLEGIVPGRPREPTADPGVAAKLGGDVIPSMPNPYFDEPRSNPFVKVDPLVESAQGQPVAEPEFPARQFHLSAHYGVALLQGWVEEPGSSIHQGLSLSQRLEVEAQVSFRRMILGLVGGMDSGLGQGGGGAVFIGEGRRRGKLKLEGTVGLGVWGNTSTSLPMYAYSGILADRPEYLEIGVAPSRLWIFARTHATASYAFNRWVDGTFRVALHLGVPNLENSSLASLLGVRVNL